jgi:CubicO group peptidase (beta-lactamase class C family)
MWCPRCGSETDASAGFCSSCGLDMATYKQMWQSGAAGTPGQAADPATSPQPQQGPAAYPNPPVYQAPPAPQPAFQGQRPNIPSHLGLAIVGLVLFWPTGIPAIVYATRVDSRLVWGDIAGAWEASQKAKVWGWVSISLTLAWVFFWILFVVVGVGIAGSGY